MVIGVPKEIKDHEYRVSLTPDGAATLCQLGHEIWLEPSAGQGSGFSDDEYRQVGATIAASKKELFEKADMILKVKEPMITECPLFRPGQVLFTYLHLAALPELTKTLMAEKITAIARETVEATDGSLPMLKPMSEIAGRLAVQIGAQYLERSYGGRGVLLGGVPGVEPGKVVVLGAGVAGRSAVRMAVGMGAQVTVLDLNVQRLQELDDLYQGRLITRISTQTAVEQAVLEGDVVVGAVLLPGARAPKVVTRSLVARMKPGAVIVDIAVDQGGCFETTRPTTHSEPVYLVDGVTHYCVTNMPGIVPRTATFALTNATLPYVVRLASDGVDRAIRSDRGLARGVNVMDGRITCPAVAEAHGLPFTPVL